MTPSSISWWNPTALYTCSPDLLKASKTLADRYQVPLATHFLENKSEAKQLEEKFGKRATQFLRESGFSMNDSSPFTALMMDEEDMRHFCRSRLQGRP